MDEAKVWAEREGRYKAMGLNSSSLKWKQRHLIGFTNGLG